MTESFTCRRVFVALLGFRNDELCRMVMGQGIALLGILWMLAAPSENARANVYDIYGFGPRAIAMGGAMTAAADDFTASFYNPAAMTVGKQVRLGVGTILTIPELYVDRSLTTTSHETVLPSMSGGLNLGWLYPFGGIFEDRLAVGISLHLPLARVVRIQGIEGQRPQFYMYQNLHDKLLFLAAMAVEPVKWLSFGVGTQVLADLNGQAHLDLDIIDGSFERRDFSVDLRPTAALMVGLHLRPFANFSVGLCWRGEHALSFSLPVVAREGDAITLALDVEQTVLYTPHQISLGLVHRFDEISLTLSADAVVMFWSMAPDPSPQLALDVGGRLLDSIGLDEALGISVASQPTDLQLVDTVSGSIGVEWQGTSWLQLRAGYGFKPTPAPRQAGTTAYLDNDAHVMSLGAGFVFMDPLRVYIYPLTLDIAGQLIYLPRRTVLRENPSDPIGHLSHGGFVWTFSMGLSYAY